jgi:hypothetical protein
MKGKDLLSSSEAVVTSDSSLSTMTSSSSSPSLLDRIKGWFGLDGLIPPSHDPSMTRRSIVEGTEKEKEVLDEGEVEERHRKKKKGTRTKVHG